MLRIGDIVLVALFIGHTMYVLSELTTYMTFSTWQGMRQRTSSARHLP